MTRTSIFLTARDTVTAETGIPHETWMNAAKGCGKMSLECKQARIRFVHKLSAMHVGDIAAFAGWDIHTVRAYRNQTVNDEPAEYGEAEHCVALWLVAYTRVKYGELLGKERPLTLDELRSGSWETEPARSEIAGKLVRHCDLNRPTVRRVLRERFGIAVEDMDITNGLALAADCEGVNLSLLRARARELNAAGARYGDRAIERLMAPWAYANAGSSPLGDAVEEARNFRRVA